jgi:hypothetical protein
MRFDSTSVYRRSVLGSATWFATPFPFSPVSRLREWVGARGYHETYIKWPESQLGSYLAGLIEGDGTFAVHETDSTAKKYSPKIIVVFKRADLPLAKYLRGLTDCGRVLIKANRGYVLWQIQDLVGVFTIVNIINGHMRTPKIEGLQRTINWLNNYIINNQNSKLPSTMLILSKIKPLKLAPLDASSIESNSWFSGFTDADGNFSINIHKRSNRNTTRVQLYYRLEIRQNYHRCDSEGLSASYFTIMSKIAMFLGVSVYSRSRSLPSSAKQEMCAATPASHSFSPHPTGCEVGSCSASLRAANKERVFFSFTVMSHSVASSSIVSDYFNKFPLLSSKYLDFKAWNYVLNLQKEKAITTSYLDEAINIKKDFNSTRTTYSWVHLKEFKFN